MNERQVNILRMQNEKLRRRMFLLKSLILIAVGYILGSHTWTQVSQAESLSNLQDGAFKSLRCQKLELTDANGTVRGKWEIKQDDEVILTLLDKTSSPRALIAVNDKGLPIISVKDPKGEGTVSMQFQLDGSPSFVIADSNRLPRVQLMLMKGSNPGLLLGDRRGNARAALRLDPFDLPLLHMSDSDNEALLNVGVTGSNRPFVTLHGPKGNGFIGTSIDSDSLPFQYWALNDPKSQLTLKLRKDPNRSLILMDSTDKELWKVP